MKIAIISSGFLPVVDGVTVTLMNRLQKLSQWGHQVLLFCPDYRALESVYPDWKNYTGNILPGVNVVNLDSTPFMDLDFERNVSQKSYLVLLQELQKFQPDIIHVDEPERLFMGFLKVPGIDFAKRNRIPCVSFFHTNFIEYGEDYFPAPAAIDRLLKFIFNALFSWIYNSYNATLVSGEVTRQKAVQMGIKNVVKSELLGVDTAQFHPDLRESGFFEKRYALPEIDQKVKLVFLGRLTPDKGWGFTLNALPNIAEEINLENVALIVAGDGPMQDEIAEQLGKITAVHLLGRIPPAEVPALLANSDIHITASEKETKGLTILEAFASGIPVLAPRSGGLIDTVREGESGFLFNPKDQGDFAEKLKILIHDPALRQKMGSQGRASVAHCNWDETVENLLKIWEAQVSTVT
jgi:glycosyltransferase involved in cell wall biosynthesis